MYNSGELRLTAIVLEVLFDLIDVKLSIIVTYHYSGNLESCDNVLLYRFPHHVGCD